MNPSAVRDDGSAEGTRRSAGEVGDDASQRRLAAIMFTDLVGYSSLTQKDETLAMELLEQHRAVVRHFIPTHGGREVKTIGDGFLVEFASALHAVRCAYDIQRSMHEAAQKKKQRTAIAARIGIHLGDVIESSGDVYGDSVNIASRIEPLADPGGICVSEQVYAQVKNKFELPLVTIGKHKLKNIEEIQAYRVVLPWEGEYNNLRNSSPESRHRIAVLPFANISPDPADEYFADGLTEEMIFCLSKINELSVISRTSVMQYKNSGSMSRKRAPDIGRELGAGSLLEGSVRKSGQKLRISVELIDVEKDEHLWAERYDRELSDVFSIQSEIAENVASYLKVRLLPLDRRRIGGAATSNVEAYTLFLRGCNELNKNSRESYLRAIDLLLEATELDPKFALAFARLAFAYAFLSFQGLGEEGRAFKSAEFAKKAIELNELLPDAHMALGFVKLYDWNLSGADIEFRRAIEISPNQASPHVYYANLLYFSRKFEESVEEIKKALELDPLSAETSNWAGTAYLYAGHYDEAIVQFQKALEIDSTMMMAQNNLGLTFVQKGLPEEGIADILKAARLAGEKGFPQVASDLGYAYSKAGRLEETRKVLERLLVLRSAESRESAQFAIPIAGLLTSLGEKEKAIDCLEEAFERRSAYLISINPDLVFDSLRNHPRFISLLRRMGLLE